VGLQPPRLEPPALEPAVDERFRALVADARLAPVFVHAPYLVNFASTSQATVDSSVSVVAATLDKAAAIGAAGVVVHAGSHLGAGRPAGLARTRAAVMPLLDRLDRIGDRGGERGRSSEHAGDGGGGPGDCSGR
jgi:deoxyribonuclease-4